MSVAVAAGSARLGRLEDLVEGERAERGPERHHGDEHAEVAHAVDDERLLAGVGVPAVQIVALVEPEADQQIRGQAHAFPAHEHAHEGIAEHEDEHGEDEEVQVDEEALEALVVVHVGDGVEVDQRADARDDQRHDHAQRVDQQRRRRRGACRS